MARAAKRTTKRVASKARPAAPDVVAPAEAGEVTAESVAAAAPATPDRTSTDIAESFRALAVKGVLETRARFEAAKSASQQAFAAIEASCDAARTRVAAALVRALDGLQADADARFRFLTAPEAAKSLWDAMSLHTEFARRQYEEAATRAREMVERARKVA